MDPEQHADAKARLERDYLAGAISAEEYTRLRRQLHESASAQEIVQEQEQESVQEHESVPAPVVGDPQARVQGAVSADADPVTGARLATWGTRAAAWFVDLIVFVALWVATFAWASSDTAGEGSFAVVFLGPPLYQWLMIGRWGQTLGKMALGIRVVRSADADRVSYPRALGRASSLWVFWIFGSLLLGLPLLLAYLWPLWNSRNQTLHDKIASTIVVKGS